MADRFEFLAEKVRNWGRWGPEDQRGTLNLIGPEVLIGATASVKQGKLFALGMDFCKQGPQLAERRFNPLLFVTDLFTPLNPAKPNAMYSDDVITMPLQAATQWDALGHVHYNGTMYGGKKAADNLGTHGTHHCSIEHLAKPGIMSRGLLLDIPRLYKTDRLPVDHHISVDDLNNACAMGGVTPQRGDIICIRTGHITRFTKDNDRIAFNGLQPGVTIEAAEWLFEHEIGAVASDNLAVEVITASMTTSDLPLPFHLLTLTEMGMPLGEMWNFEALADDCAKDGQYSFLLSAPPLSVPGAFGSPINPLALK
ncbi:MAG: cyclase family protein [Sphingobium sp.]